MSGVKRWKRQAVEAGEAVVALVLGGGFALLTVAVILLFATPLGWILGVLIALRLMGVI